MSGWRSCSSGMLGWRRGGSGSRRTFPIRVATKKYKVAELAKAGAIKNLGKIARNLQKNPIINKEEDYEGNTKKQFMIKALKLEYTQLILRMNLFL